ncbi:MAG: ATP-binding cassette domain-containing protein [Desulfobacterales bacterium]
MSEVKSLLSAPAPLLTLKGVSIRLRERRVVRDLDWILRQGEHWAVLGPNGAGKSSFARGLTGELAVVAGRIERHGGRSAPSRMGYVSFERHQRLLVREAQADPAREFSGNHQGYTRTADILDAPDEATAVLGEEIAALIDTLALERIGARGIQQLSTGELRKVMITRCLTTRPEILILDEPFDGLDQPSRAMIRQMLSRIMGRGIAIVLITQRREELLPGLTHALVLNAGRAQFQGPLKDLPPETLAGTESNQSTQPAPRPPEPLVHPLRSAAQDSPIIRMDRVTVRYGSAVIFNNLTWIVRRHEHWAVVGPNGAGKSTLMALIAADHPQAYANRIELFGRQRGSGESIWEIKQRIGMVSFEQQVRYQTSITAFQVILSGFFDSVGLYRRASSDQMQQARASVRRLNLGALASRPFNQLSHGERRLVLLARAVVKTPQVLILDEPCQGLDPLNRQRVLAQVERIAKAGSQLIFVTHHLRELPSVITHQLRLPGPRDSTPIQIRALKSV